MPVDPEVVLTVNYDKKTIDVSDESVRIYYSPKGNGDPEKPRQVRWVALNLKGEDGLFIRPKEGQSKQLFKPNEEGTYRLFWPHVAAISGPPFDPFAGTEATQVEWRYEIEIQREGKAIFGKDPSEFIERAG